MLLASAEILDFTVWNIIIIMRFLPVSLIFLSALGALSGCSDSNNGSSSTSNVEGWVGAQGLNNAQVVVNQVAESGQVSVDSNDIYLGLRESTNSEGHFNATVSNDELILFIARGQIANVDKDNDNLATQYQCQLIAGCLLADGEYAFGDYYPATEGFEWRSVGYTLSNGSRNNVNALTTLAAEFAYQYDVKYGYDNHQAHDHSDFEDVASAFHKNQTFTPYDVVLANSQVANLFSLQDIIGDLPANLTQLNNFNQNIASVQNQIRYGALLAGLQQLELEYRIENPSVEDEFITLVATQFAEDQGQFYHHSPIPSRALTLQNLYQTAHDNLNGIVANLSNVEAKAAAAAVVANLASEIITITAAADDTKTSAVADDLSQLLTATEIEEFNVGLEKTKLFVNDLLNYQQTFWQPEYKSELDDYLLMLKSIGDDHKENLESLVQEFALIQEYYVTCFIGEQCTDTRFTVITERKDTANSLGKVLVLDGGAIHVSQKVADINLLDDIDEPTSSHGMDVLITGTLEKNNLVLTLAHDLDSAEENIDVPSAMRIYYSEPVSEVVVQEIIGYELIWGEFQLYDKTKLGQDFDSANPDAGAETELSGAFRIFYRGVRDPQNLNTPNDSELRFNIEEWVLSSVISDQVDDDAGDDRERTSLIISARSTNPSTYYPAARLAKFDGFFVTNDANPINQEVQGLLQYQLGQEDVSFGNSILSVETIDFINLLDKDIRYRFYPDERVKDELDSDGDGDVEELVDMHRIEECELDETSGKVVTCGPKSKLFEKRNLQQTINDFWELGLFQRTTIAGRGTYYVDFPATADSQGCLALDTLNNNQGAMKGVLIEQQVLGLDSVRLFAEVKIEDASLVDLPNTLFDMTVVAPTEEKYRVTATLSHNYSGTTTDATGVILGTGGSASSLLVSYDTSADFENSGNLSIAKGGVTLTLGDGSSVSEDQDITAFLSQSYDSNSVHYKIIEDAEGKPDRCVLSTGSNYVKDPADIEEVFYLNYRDVLYGTARPEGANNIWTIRYIDGSWLVPGSDGGSTGS